ncbi:MAG: hypothetical protein JXB10_01445 [Pirellulales bacterium]|nr:hypothetical protein [Pirellulales bacterium]
MNKIVSFLRRVFRKPRSTRRYEYLPASALPSDAAKLTRAGVVQPWRIDFRGEAWFQSEVGAVEWFNENLEGANDA